MNVQKDIDDLIAYGPIIEECWEDNVMTGFMRNGDYLSHDTIHQLIGQWIHLADSDLCNCREECHCPQWMKESIHYYINDLNRHLSPKELREKILEMTSLEEKGIKVKECVVLTEIPTEEVEIKPIRFFYDGKISEETLIKIFDLSKVTLVEGYGYAYLKDPQKENELIGRSFNLDGINVLFN